MRSLVASGMLFTTIVLPQWGCGEADNTACTQAERLCGVTSSRPSDLCLGALRAVSECIVAQGACGAEVSQHCQMASTIDMAEQSPLPGPEAERCDDGIDNDRDGFVDCVDSDCRNALACTESMSGVENTDALCSDGISNDGDIFIDCGDVDCFEDEQVTFCRGLTCEGCITYAFEGRCAAARQRCVDVPDCGRLFDCVETCEDEVCSENCSRRYPNGVAALNAYLVCVTADCDAVCGLGGQ